jgi:hypothetical protein
VLIVQEAVNCALGTAEISVGFWNWKVPTVSLLIPPVAEPN